MEHDPYVIEIQVAWRDLDALGHVNNAVYATYFETARLEYLTHISGGASNLFSLILAEITISYRSPALLRERLLVGVRVAEIRNSSFLIDSQITEKASGRLVATSRAVMVHYDYNERRSKTVPPEWREAIAQFQGESPP